MKEQIYEFVSDPLVNKLVDKLNPVKLEDGNGVLFSKEKKNENQIEIEPEDIQQDVILAKRAIKRCYNAGIPVSYFQGNSTHNTTTQGCVCTLDRYTDDCRSLRKHLCTPKLKSPVRN